MDLMKLTNVVVDEEAGKRYGLNTDTTFTSKAALEKTLWSLATTHPHWKFIVQEGDKYPNTNTFAIRTVFVYDCGEKLGHLATERYRQEYCVCVTSANGLSTRTKDAAKAIALGKKMLAPRDIHELIEEAENRTERVLKQAAWAENRKRDAIDQVLRPEAVEFALTVQREQFEQYLSTLAGSAALFLTLANHEKHLQDEETVMGIVNAWGAKSSYLVLRVHTQYFVRRGGTVETYTDETFPEALRGKLGLLKLVTDGQMVSSVGCRINDKTFLLMEETC